MQAAFQWDSISQEQPSALIVRDLQCSGNAKIPIGKNGISDLSYSAPRGYAEITSVRSLSVTVTLSNKETGQCEKDFTMEARSHREAFSCISPPPCFPW